jgi:prephenate dehydrogenase
LEEKSKEAKMKLFKKVAIIGTGLIGGSIALAIKKHHLAERIVGVSRHNKSLLLAKKKGAIDKGSLSLDIIKDADLLILAAPVNIIIKLAPSIAKIVRKDCIVTDVGSTKEKIVASLEKRFLNFVGSHPLAGSEKRGIINAEADIFKGSLCILTPTKNTNKKAFKKIKLLWSNASAKTIILSPSTHDNILSFVSHLPHIVAFSLISAIPKQYLKFASTGLKDTTRIAASDSELWSEIFLSNKKNILKAIELLQDNLSRIKTSIQRKDKKRLVQILKEAKIKRQKLG